MMRIDAVNGLELKTYTTVNHNVGNKMTYDLIIIKDLYPMLGRMRNARLLELDGNGSGVRVLRQTAAKPCVDAHRNTYDGMR